MSNQQETKSYEDLYKELLPQYKKATERIDLLKNAGKELIKKNNDLLQYADISRKEADLRFELKEIARFVKSKAFPKFTAEQIYVIIKAGQAIGLDKVTALKTFYIVNGRLEVYGSGMIALLTGKGFSITYEDGNDGPVDTCEVEITTPDGKKYKEIVRADDQILQNSTAMGISSEHKLRFHGVRKILTFYLPHIINAVNVEVSNEITPELSERLGGVDDNTVSKTANEIFGDDKIDITPVQQKLQLNQKEEE